MKKIVAVNCSPRAAWNTAALVREAARGAQTQGADHYLTIEDAVTVAEILLEKITQEESQ